MATDEPFAQAARDWDLETLYADLASVKGKHLTPVDKLHLRGLLCGYSPAEIAEKLSKNVKGVEVNFCNTIYQYVKGLVGRTNGKVENWRNITEWLEESGYKIQPSIESQSSDCLPLKFSIKKANISFDKNQLIIDINLRIIASSPLEPSTEELEPDNNDI